MRNLLLIYFIVISGFVFGCAKKGDCPICLEDLTSDPIKTIICNHSFHEACINLWQGKNDSCPVCRAPIEKKIWSQGSSDNKFPLLHSQNIFEEDKFDSLRRDVSLENHEQLKRYADFFKAYREKQPISNFNLIGINLMGGRLNRSNFSGLNLSEAYLYCTHFNHARLRETRLNYANLQGVLAEEADFRGATLIKANLQKIWAPGANFREADLREADLRKANLEGADLRGADLRGADLRGAVLWFIKKKGANFTGARMEWSVGFIPPKS